MTLDASRPMLVRRIALFCGGFFVLWAVLVFALWHSLDVPDDVRKLVRALFWFGAAAFWIFWTRPAQPLAAIGITPVSRRAMLWTLGAFALVIAWNMLRVTLSGGSLQMPAGSGLGWGFVGVLEEEIIFRGIIQPALVSVLPALLAILATAGLFLAIHVPGWLMLGTPDVVTIISVFLIGLACGALRHCGRSLWPAVGAHWANNLGAQL